MDLPFSVIVGVIVAVIIVLIAVALALFVRETGQSSIQAIWNIGDYIKQLIGFKPSG